MEKHEHTRAAVNRVARAAGHLLAVKGMLEDGRDCTEVLIQLSAVRAEIVNVSKLILKDHLAHCVVDAVRQRDEEAIARLMGAVDKLL